MAKQLTLLQEELRALKLDDRQHRRQSRQPEQRRDSQQAERAKSHHGQPGQRKHREITVETNTDECADEEGAKADDRRRILVVSSSSWGIHPKDKQWSTKVQEILRNRFEPELGKIDAFVDCLTLFRDPAEKGNVMR